MLGFLDRYFLLCFVFKGKSNGIFGNDCFSCWSVGSNKDTFWVLHQVNSLLLKYVQFKGPLLLNKKCVYKNWSVTTHLFFSLIHFSIQFSLSNLVTINNYQLLHPFLSSLNSMFVLLLLFNIFRTFVLLFLNYATQLLCFVNLINLSVFLLISYFTTT